MGAVVELRSNLSAQRRIVLGERPLHVLQMSTMFGMGGISRHVLALSGWLRAQGHSVSFAGTPGPWLNPDAEPDFLSLDTHRASGDRAGAHMADRLASLLVSAVRLRRWLKRNPVDLIHAHESAPALVARLATLGARTPVIVTYHGSEIDRVPQYGALVRRCADKVISVSRRSAQDLATLGAVPSEKLRVIGLGLKSPPPVSESAVSELRRRLLGEDGQILVVTVARLTAQKGVDHLVQVVRRVAEARADIRFALVGDGPQMDEAKDWARAAGVADRLHFVGRSEEPHLYMQAADIFLLTSRWEALPFTIAEAFQVGTPAIATDCGGVAELIDDTVGRVAPVGAIGAIAHAVLELAGDQPLRAAMARAALARSREDRFKPDYNHRQIEMLYRELAPRPAAPPSRSSRT